VTDSRRAQDFLRPELTFQSLRAVCMQERHAPGSKIGGAEFVPSRCPPSAGAAEPQRPAGELLAERGGVIREGLAWLGLRSVE
jgi:hypothetical protein